MSDLERDFGPYAFYIKQLQKDHFDIPEALTDALFKIVHAGLWNLPDGGKYEAVVKARTWLHPDVYEERAVVGWGLSPLALRKAFPWLEEDFITTVWEKLGNRLENKLRLYSVLLREPGRFHADLEQIGKEARAMGSAIAVVQSGIVTKFCEAILDRELAVFLGNCFSRDSYAWLNELARYLLPIQASIEFLDSDFDIDISLLKSMQLIRAAIDEEVLKRWGDDAVVANMRHQSSMCKGLWGDCWDGRKEFYPDPLCKICVVSDEIRKATLALHEELRQKHIYIDFSYPQFKSVEEVAEYREEVLRTQEELERIRAENGDPSGEEISSEETATSDPFVDDVIYLVEGLTKLGVSPNTAADAASKLMTS